ncbi:MAG: RidA family protein [Xanthobacteraceae bacterium]
MRTIIAAGALLALSITMAAAQSSSPKGVKTLNPDGAIKTTGTWSLGTRAGDFVFVAGMRGIDPANNTLVSGDEARIRQAFLNMKLIAESEGAGLRDAVRLVVYVTDMYRFRPAREQSAGGAVGAGSLSAAHHRRGRPAQSGRYLRGKRNVLRTGQEIGGDALGVRDGPALHI